MSPVDPVSWLELAVRYGLGTVLSLAAVFALWKIVTFLLRENTTREERLSGIIEKHLLTMHELIVSQDKKVDVVLVEMKVESSRREKEHEHMIELLQEQTLTLRQIREEWKRDEAKS